MCCVLAFPLLLQGFTGDVELLLADLADAEVADEDLLLDRQLGAGAKLRRRFSQVVKSSNRVHRKGFRLSSHLRSSIHQ